MPPGRVFLAWPIGALYVCGVLTSSCQRREVVLEASSTPVVTAVPTAAVLGGSEITATPLPSIEEGGLPRSSGTPDTRGTRRKPTGSTATPPASLGFALYTLSRGKGVPDKARDALRQVREFAEADRGRGLAVSIETTRIGLEGETRLCVEYKDPKAGSRALEQARALVRGIDLVNLVVEPCATSAPQNEKPK